MDWLSLYLAREAIDANDREHRRSRARVGGMLNRAKAGQSPSQLDASIGRIALLARATAELCMAKGIFTEAELRQRLTEVDMADGAEDGRLDPDVVMPGETKLADLKPIVDKPRIPPRKRL